MGRVISDRIHYGAAEHVKSVVFGAVDLQYSDFSMQSAITVVGFGSTILTSIGVGSYSTRQARGNLTAAVDDLVVVWKTQCERRLPTTPSQPGYCRSQRLLSRTRSLQLRGSAGVAPDF